MSALYCTIVIVVYNLSSATSCLQQKSLPIQHGEYFAINFYYRISAFLLVLNIEVFQIKFS